MKNVEYEFDVAKSRVLRKTRGAGFEEMVIIIENGGVVDVYAHPNQAVYPGQAIYEVDIAGYIWRVPHVRQGNVVRLITCYPCRQATKESKRKKEKSNDY